MALKLGDSDLRDREVKRPWRVVCRVCAWRGVRIGAGDRWDSATCLNRKRCPRCNGTVYVQHFTGRWRGRRIHA